MLIRFQTLARHEDSRCPCGIFQAAFELRDEGRLGNLEEERLEREMAWLRMHLPAPACLDNEDNLRAICWFKPEAHDAIARVRGIVTLLTDVGVAVEMVKTDDPGTVVYEDRFQVVAKPRQRGRTRRRHGRASPLPPARRAW